MRRTKSGHSPEYVAYLKSPEWLAKRRLLTRQYGSRCTCCDSIPTSGNPLDLHHLTYERLGNERLEDLTVVCRKCHDLIHGWLKHCGSIRASTKKVKEIITKRIEHEQAPYIEKRQPRRPHVPKTPEHPRKPAVHPGARGISLKEKRAAHKAMLRRKMEAAEAAKALQRKIQSKKDRAKRLGLRPPESQSGAVFM